MTRSDKMMAELSATLKSLEKFKKIGIDVVKLFQGEVETSQTTQEDKPVVVQTSTKKVVKKKPKLAKNLDSLTGAVIAAIKTKNMKPSELVTELKSQDFGVKEKHLPASIAEVLTYLKQTGVVKRLEDKTYQLV